LVIGIGIDDGIHIVHRYLEEGRGSLPQVIQLTGKAIFLTTATTCLAFSSFLFSSHPSLRFLAIIPIIGISICFLGAIIFLPALMRVTVDRRQLKSIR
jgi:predicted RND superfamily exporter protein